MRFLLLSLICISCASKPVTYSSKVDECINRYVDKNINALDRTKVCQAIYGTKK